MELNVGPDPQRMLNRVLEGAVRRAGSRHTQMTLD